MNKIFLGTDLGLLNNGDLVVLANMEVAAAHRVRKPDLYILIKELSDRLSAIEYMVQETLDGKRQVE